MINTEPVVPLFLRLKAATMASVRAVAAKRATTITTVVENAIARHLAETPSGDDTGQGQTPAEQTVVATSCESPSDPQEGQSNAATTSSSGRWRCRRCDAPINLFSTCRCGMLLNEAKRAGVATWSS